MIIHFCQDDTITHEYLAIACEQYYVAILILSYKAESRQCFLRSMKIWSQRRLQRDVYLGLWMGFRIVISFILH
jgi:hypothetical protein